MISALFGWFWLIANLAVVWLALTRKLNPIARSLVVGGALLGASAGLANGLVMTVNGWRMPVESHGIDWGAVPVFLSGPEHTERFYCWAFTEYAPVPDPWKPHGIHIEVPPPIETPPSGAADAPPAGTPEPFRPKLAFLDDRHGFVICGEHTILSKGDVMGVLGVVLMLPGLLLVFLGWTWRKLRRKT